MYFDNTYEDEWIVDSLMVGMIKDVYKSEVVGAHLIESPVLGPISTKEFLKMKRKLVYERMN